MAIARENAASHGVAERIVFVESDLLAKVAPQQFDCIVSNPPYVSAAEFDKLAPSVRNFEPRDALLAGPTGTEVIARLAPQAAERLKPDGWLLLEVSPMIEPAVRQLLEADAAWRIEPTIKDLAGLPRIVQARRR